MRYLICQEWTNTTDNHAGMKHMCNLLKAHYPKEYSVIVFPDLYKNLSSNRWIRKLQNSYIRKYQVPKRYLKIGRELSKEINEGDEVYLLEYCSFLFPQEVLAKYLRKEVPKLKIYGMVHLVPQKLEEAFTPSQLQNCIKPLDSVLTLGSSLSNFFIQKVGINNSKVKTMFHYVDLDYYKPDQHLSENKNSSLSVLVMGNQKRNFDLLYRIVKNSPEISFTICQGVMNLSHRFKDCDNVRLVGFVGESELLAIMQNSDVSLNIMDDTAGSNVITTSMAVGLAIVVSEVGSIKDYCKADGAIYCDNEEVSSFTTALKELKADHNRLLCLKTKSLEYSKNLSLINLHRTI